MFEVKNMKINCPKQERGTYYPYLDERGITGFCHTALQSGRKEFLSGRTAMRKVCDLKTVTIIYKIYV